MLPNNHCEIGLKITNILMQAISENFKEEVVAKDLLNYSLNCVCISIFNLAEFVQKEIKEEKDITRDKLKETAIELCESLMDKIKSAKNKNDNW